MEFVEGETLHDLLEREKRLSPERAFELTSAICDGIGAAHKQGIVHRDMKPLNIMLLKDKKTIKEAVKVLDFGLAKIKSGELLGSFVQAQTQGLMGSPYYMAPEQFRKIIDRRIFELQRHYPEQTWLEWNYADHRAYVALKDRLVPTPQYR